MRALPLRAALWSAVLLWPVLFASTAALAQSNRGSAQTAKPVITNAELSSPTGVAVDSQGQVYIISSASTGQVVRKLGPGGYVNFGSQFKGTSSPAHLVTLANTGNSAMTLTSYNFGGMNPGDFAMDPATTSCILTTGATLSAGQSCKVGVIFTPAASGARHGYLNFLDNTVTNMNTVYFSGTGTLPAPTFTITAPASGAMETSGTAFTFSVSVTSTSGPKPTGTVKMLLNGTAISGSPATLNGSAVASLSVTSTTTGTKTLSATYNGDANYAVAGPITRAFTIVAAASKPARVAVTSSANPATLCSAIAFSVAVTGTGNEMPSGAVTLMNGTELLGEASLVKGTASLKNIRLAAGTNELTANYLGDSTYEPAASAPFKQVVSASSSCVSGLAPYQPSPTPGGIQSW